MTVLRDTLDRIKPIQARLAVHLPSQLRDWSANLNLDSRGILLTGPRGTGKTTWMLTQARQGHYLYFSADNPIVSAVPLFDLVEAAFMQGYEGVFVDEVHYAAGWSVHLKAIYDSFPSRFVVAGGSSSAGLQLGNADLSRRFVVRQMPLLSFREYLILECQRDVPKISPYSFDEDEIGKLLREVNVLRHFNDYLRFGFRPFFLETRDDYAARLLNTVRKSIESDVPFLVPRLSENHLRLMNAVVGYLAISPVPVLQVNSLCSEWALSKEKLYQLLEAMERVRLIRIVRKRNDTKMHSVGAKILLHDPSVYALFGENRGTVREAYVAAASVESGHSLHASDDERAYDFLIDGKAVEVGGRRKDRKAADVVVRDNIDLPAGNTLPMWLLGLEY
ncbi:MAG: ATP-binding protein [Kiritimatiellaeota bacterium]|nr:ATP-binding protein [Kiritimatiellota bacterium]